MRYINTPYTIFTSGSPTTTYSHLISKKKPHNHQPQSTKTMHYPTTTLSLLLLLTSTISAQTRCDPVASAIPTCGLPCIASAASSVGCGGVDYACRCSNAEAIHNGAMNCVIGNCGIEWALQVQSSASAVCACVTGAARV
ncbi:CFEM domain-containing [Pyrenophora seminiperda CCB06]|uniref:CFEM domain-containing n=1 Tax=Pyrenophora seminiperda CCB06 TaxID=1302712 RepID=A0A3M7MDB5_9PLEO|nr:CFEM domain-containing [Pyrenophora seminiperda CCB06]